MNLSMDLLIFKNDVFGKKIHRELKRVREVRKGICRKIIVFRDIINQYLLVSSFLLKRTKRPTYTCKTIKITYSHFANRDKE